MSTTTASKGLEVTEYFAQTTQALDLGQMRSSDGLTVLGAQALLELGAPSNEDGQLHHMAELISLVAEQSLASAFSLWAHRMVIEYLKMGSRHAELDALLAQLVTGTLPGATAMAAAVNSAWGYGQLGVRFETVGTNVVLNGKINWASNLFEDGFLVVTAAEDAHGNQIVVTVPSATPGVVVRPYPDLLALNATASTSIELHQATVPTALIITHNVSDFLRRVRGPFLLLQASFALGLAKAALTSTTTRLSGLNQVFVPRFNEIEAEYLTANTELAELSQLKSWDSAEERVLCLRLAASGIAEDAVRLEGRAFGGAAYFAGSPTARRLREVAFLPIQSPTEALLRHELACLPSTI